MSLGGVGAAGVSRGAGGSVAWWVAGVAEEGRTGAPAVPGACAEGGVRWGTGAVVACWLRGEIVMEMGEGVCLRFL